MASKKEETKSVFEKILKTGANEGKNTYVLSESPFIKDRDMIPTSVPILNFLGSGDPLNGGLMPGLTILAGERATFKTRIALKYVKAYMDHDPEAFCIYYDSEFGSSLPYLEDEGINMDRVAHVGIDSVENLKFDAAKKLNEIKRGTKCIIFIDSIGMLASNKEIEDALSDKAVADMTRAKALRSFFRILTPQLIMKNIPCITIAHTYKTMEMFAKTVVSGGTAPMYAANDVFLITKIKEKEAGEDDKKKKVLTGFIFNVTVAKSRTLREESQVMLEVSFENGLARNSGLIGLGLDAGLIKVSKGVYTIEDEKYSYDELMDEDEVLDRMLATPEFNKFLSSKYLLSAKK